MKFYAREKELQFLEKQYTTLGSSSKMTVLTGRRRIGKTSLATKFANNKKSLYLFISKKSEKLLCKEFVATIQDKLDYPVIGEISNFKDIFKLLLEIAKKEEIVIIIDEFQEFYNINPSVYSDLQNLWDSYKFESKMQVIFIGSIYSLMHKIFQNSKEPLFGRADMVVYLKPFSPKTIKQILLDNNSFTTENLFIIFLITGGIPRYIEILVNDKKWSEKLIIDYYISEDSPFINEGKTILIEEFGKEYGTYFSILELMSEGRTSRSEIESILEKNIGGYLEKLEIDYDLINKNKPVGAKPTGKVQKYHIKDNFLKFWFRFIQINRTAIENYNFEYIKKYYEKYIQVYKGPLLEKMYQEIFKEKSEFNIIGNYWERGNLNEIDLVAVNDLDKKIIIGEIKMNLDKAKMNDLKNKSVKLLKKYKDYSVEYLLLGMQNLDKYI
ncbi:AAA family ATPase [Thiospirochaeta perfilievii]|uniref:AAA family ATPase n=1 Tax=Thiospirochaeta perfilievii TaxID=252967 RepID=A0A5C1QDW4_9SPIO|nr:ATP-binding protein [Thiospirochaeta perfilievii]QEN04570.1 AAA family ATPase [Thiospirochaeta perfilievii]QEN06263.1 AAA family ATPase [Thiospirochaeta perfilievii]